MTTLTKQQQEYFDNTGVNPIEEKKHSIKYYNKRIQVEKNALAYFTNLLKLSNNKYSKMLKTTDWDFISINYEIKEIRNSLKEYRKGLSVYLYGTFWRDV
tara:strand:+ start:3058 stop:3357 length:300 start_codon:yes stop_codon:yes gene_type:complete